MKKIFTLFAAFGLLPMFSFSQTTVTFNYTGAVQLFTVPPCVDSIVIDVRGAQGGNIDNLSQPPIHASGGYGGRVQGKLAVTPGQVLQIFAGGQGTSDNSTLGCLPTPGGFNGGGDGQTGNNAYNYNAGGGGGASDIRFAPYTLAERVAVAGGGGGAGCSGCDGAAYMGGNGGGLIAADGQDASCFPGCQNGKGGTPSAGGAAGIWACTSCTAATAGALGDGGAGNDSTTCSGGVNCGSGGGGGGGWYGGGGGNNGPGGGGNSYTAVWVTDTVHTQGFTGGNGLVIITYIPCTGILSHQAQNPVLDAYPNPFNESLNITANGEIKLTDAYGKEVITTITITGDYTLNTAHLSQGVYFLQVKTTSGILNRKLEKHSSNK